VACGVQRTKKRAVAYDLWDSQDLDVNNQTTLTELARKPIFTKKPVGVKSLNAVAAVEVDEPGCSYNPPKDAHEEVLAKVRHARPACHLFGRRDCAPLCMGWQLSLLSLLMRLVRVAGCRGGSRKGLAARVEANGGASGALGD